MTWPRTWLCILLLAGTTQAAIDGTVVNRTTGKPQAGTIVTLYALGGRGGMQPLKTVKSDAQGTFRIDEEIRGGPHLLQAIHAAVLYNQALTPGSKTTGLELAVYESTAKPETAKVSQHMIILEPLKGVLHVNETVMVQNSGNTTYNDPANGTLRLFVPDGTKGDPRLMATAPQGMPVERSVVKTTTPNVYKVDFAVKPGDTRFDVTYVMSMPEPPVFAGKVLHSGGPVRLVAPQGVTLTGDSITMIGQEPKTQAKVYDVKGKEYSVKVEGTGQLSSAESDETGSAEAGGRGGPGIQTIRARVYNQVVAILGLALLILALGFILLYRRGADSPANEQRPEAKRR